MLPHIHREICLPGIHSPEQADVAGVTTATAICRERPRLIRIAIAAMYADDQAQKQALLPSEPGAVFAAPGRNGWPLGDKAAHSRDFPAQLEISELSWLNSLWFYPKCHQPSSWS